MTKYLAELKGESADLEDLPGWFRDGDVYVASENGRYYLYGDALEICGSPQQAHEVAEGLLEELHAVGLLLWPSLKRPEIEAIVEQQIDGERKRIIFAAMYESVRAKDRIEVEINGVPQAAQRPTEAQQLLAASRLSAHARNAMLIWSDSHKTWPRLYRIIEELEAELGTSVSKAGFCSDNERDRFNQSANSANVAGKDSRHASGKFAAPKRPMSLQEATSFVAACMHKTLQAVRRRAAA